MELAAEHEIENAANMRRQDIMFSILKSVADKGASIHGDGVIDILQDGFGFLRAPESNYLPGRMIYMLALVKLEGLGLEMEILLKVR